MSTIRPATRADIPQLQRVRAAVRENVLRTPGKVTVRDYEEYIDGRGRTWVAEHDDAIVGFVSVDGEKHWMWALFVDPPHEGRGHGRALLAAALAWLRGRGAARVALTTEPGTRAEAFYRAAGFVAQGLEHGELRFVRELGPAGYTPGPMNLHDIAIPQMTRVVGQVHVWLDKAEAHAAAKKFDPQVLLTARLAPDQWHFARQVQAITITPVRLAALLRGVEPPAMVDLEPTLAAVRARVDETLAHLAALRPEEFRGAEERVIPLSFLPGKGMNAPAFVLQFSLPNFYFHAATAYSILRHNGVDVGKIDFIGQIDIRDL